MLKQCLIAVRATVALAVLTGLLFPLLVTVMSQAFFSDKANGSLVRNAGGEVIGSSLLGQKFDQPRYFHPRPSAAGSGYAGEASGATNLGPTSEKLILGEKDNLLTKDQDESFAGVASLAAAYRKENGLPNGSPIPPDAVTRSGSGLDPDISVANALYQVKRVASARNVSQTKLRQLIKKHVYGRQLGFLGEPRLNVLKLNLALDQFGK